MKVPKKRKPTPIATSNMLAKKPNVPVIFLHVNTTPDMMIPMNIDSQMKMTIGTTMKTCSLIFFQMNSNASLELIEVISVGNRTLTFGGVRYLI